MATKIGWLINWSSIARVATTISMAPPGIKIKPIRMEVARFSLPILAPSQAPPNLPNIATAVNINVGQISMPAKKSILRPSVAKNKGTKMALRVFRDAVT